MWGYLELDITITPCMGSLGGRGTCHWTRKTVGFWGKFTLNGKFCNFVAPPYEFQSIRSSSLGSVHDGTVVSLPDLGGKKNGVVVRRTYWSGRRKSLRYPFCPPLRSLYTKNRVYHQDLACLFNICVVRFTQILGKWGGLVTPWWRSWTIWRPAW